MTEQSSKASSSSYSSSWLLRPHYSRAVCYLSNTNPSSTKLVAPCPSTIPSLSYSCSSNPSTFSSTSDSVSDVKDSRTATEKKIEKKNKKKHPLIQFSNIFSRHTVALSTPISGPAQGEEKGRGPRQDACQVNNIQDGSELKSIQDGSQVKNIHDGSEVKNIQVGSQVKNIQVGSEDTNIEEENHDEELTLNCGLDFSFPSPFSSSPSISDNSLSLDHSLSSKNALDCGAFNPMEDSDQSNCRVSSIPCMKYNGDISTRECGSPTSPNQGFFRSVFNSLSLSSTRLCSDNGSVGDDSSSHGKNSMAANNSFNDPISTSPSNSPRINGSSMRSSSWFSKISPIGSPNNSQYSPVVSPKGSPRNSFRKLSLSPKGSPQNSFRKTLNEGAKGLMQRVPSWSSFLSNSMGGEKAVLSSEHWMLDLSQLLLGERFYCGKHSRLYRGVYKDTPVAVKVIHQPEDDGPLVDRLQQNFTQEVTMLSCLQHPRVIKFIAACKKPPVLCVVTEYLPGGSLRSFLSKRRGEPPPLEDVVQIALEIACGMEYLHMKGVIHRDLKSENLVLAEDGSVKIVDFGVSRFESECNFREDDPGTYRWMAPEMLCMRPCSRKVDIYSFGIVLWELLTTLLPYEDLTPIQAAFLVSNKDMRPSIPSDCPPDLQLLMKQCWSTDPDARPEFWEILRTLNVFQQSLDHIDIVTFDSPLHERCLPSWLEP